MKWLAAGLTLVNISTVSALLLGIASGGLHVWVALISLWIGVAAAIFAFFVTRDSNTTAASDSGGRTAPVHRARRLAFWVLAGVFALFAFRSFCWLLFLDGNEWKVQSPNNLGDLALHLTYIKNFANGVPLWPDNPIHSLGKLRYPGGTDLFNAVLVKIGCDLPRSLIWAGLIGSLASFFALWRWGGSFTVAGFLFNGGLAGFQLLQTGQFLDYQGVPLIAWKSLPLAMFVTQRGLLYALPAGLLLLYQWRAKYFANQSRADHIDRRALLPLWLEVSLYASMPLFHIHTFMALSIVAAIIFAIGDNVARKQLGLLVGIALLPATFFVWTITDHFTARSLLEWQPGWVQKDPEMGGFSEPLQLFGLEIAIPRWLNFWLLNFGMTMPLLLVLVGAVCHRLWRSISASRSVADGNAVAGPSPFRSALQLLRSDPALAFITPAVFLFIFALIVKTAPWEWDNIKLIIWAYLILLPFLWSELIARWPIPIRIMLCAVLFASGFVSLFGGLIGSTNGYFVADRAELDSVGSAMRNVPVTARFATFPTYNHPILLQGRRVVLGYPGHLWTQGIDYRSTEEKLTALMQGAPDWKENARQLGAHYLFWGREEKTRYAASTRPWEREAKLVQSGFWGAIYDLEAGPH